MIWKCRKLEYIAPNGRCLQHISEYRLDVYLLTESSPFEALGPSDVGLGNPTELEINILENMDMSKHIHIYSQNKLETL